MEGEWSTSIATSLIALTALSQDPDAPPTLRAGSPVDGEITELDVQIHSDALALSYPGASVLGEIYLIQVEETGPYHIDLKSYEFDAYLILRDDFGDVLAEDNDGYVLTHARLDLPELRSGTTYWLEACALDGGRGALEVQLTTGAAPVLTSQESVQLNAHETIRFVESRFGPNSVRAANELSARGAALHDRGLYRAARPYFERALAIREAVHGPDHIGITTSVITLGSHLMDQGLFTEAQLLYERALAIRERELAPGDIRIGNSLTNLATVMCQQGLYKKARVLHERGIAIHDATRAADDPDLALSLDNLAVCLLEVGLYGEARPHQERALAIRQKVFGGDHPKVAFNLQNLSILYGRLGMNPEARECLERALAICETAYGAKHVEVARALVNLASVLSIEDLDNEAQSCYERALSIRRKALGRDHPLVATILMKLGVLHMRQGRYSQARELIDSALASCEAALGAEHLTTGDCLFLLADLARCQGRAAEAKRHFDRGFRIQEMALGLEHPDVGYTLSHLADRLLATGRPEEARPLYERAIAILTAARGAEHPSIALIEINLAMLLIAGGDPESAWELVYGRQAERLAHLRGVLAALSEQESYAYASRALPILEAQLGIALTLDDDDRTRAAYDALLAWKGQVTRMLSASRSAMASRVPVEQGRLLEDLRTAQRGLSRVFSDARLSPSVRAARIDELIATRNRLEIRWQRAVTSEFGQPPTLQALVETLPQNSASIDFFVHRAYRPGTPNDPGYVVGGGPRVPHLTAWISRPAAAGSTGSAATLAVVELGPAGQIQGAIRAFLADLVSRRGIGIAERDSHIPELNADLHALLWEPIAAHLAGAEQLFISPDSFLGTLPFETIQLDDGSYLLERFSVVYLQDFENLRAIGLGDTNDPSLLSVGGVNFARADVDTAHADGPESTIRIAAASLESLDPLRGTAIFWGRLPHTEYESQVVFDLHETSFPPSTERVLLQDTMATEERLKRELTTHSIVHMATHGYFQPEGSVSLWDEARAQPPEANLDEDSRRRLAGRHPGLLSGLVCAGANSPANDGRDDGFLTAEEVGWLNLSGVDLVVLSACETGLGESRSGEGLLGLRRAFQTAGARTVISALWQVKDRATGELMQTFYANMWRDHMQKGEALRAAQLEMLHRNRRENDGDGLPSTWGAFVLSGDWR